MTLSLALVEDSKPIHPAVSVAVTAVIPLVMALSRRWSGMAAWARRISAAKMASIVVRRRQARPQCKVDPPKWKRRAVVQQLC